MREKIKTLLRLFCFEWKKQFLKPSIWIALLLLTIISFAQLKSIFETQSLLSSKYTDAKWKPLYQTLYSDFSGIITNEKIERLMGIYLPLEQKTADLTASTRTDDPTTYTGNVYSDRLFFKWCFVAPMEYAYLYQSYAESIAVNARENATFYSSVGNHYEAEKNAQLASLFDGRRIDHFAYTEPHGVSATFGCLGDWAFGFGSVTPVFNHAAPTIPWYSGNRRAILTISNVQWLGTAVVKGA